MAGTSLRSRDVTCAITPSSITTIGRSIFSSGVINNAGASAKAAETKNEQATSPGSKGAVSAKESKISVTKATGVNAYTVEGLYSNSAKLDKSLHTTARLDTAK